MLLSIEWLLGDVPASSPYPGELSGLLGGQEERGNYCTARPTAQKELNPSSKELDEERGVAGKSSDQMGHGMLGR